MSVVPVVQNDASKFDRVVVIGDSLEPPQNKGGSDGAGEADPGDEDCVVLDGDPDRPVAVARDMGAASDELEIVAVKGQVFVSCSIEEAAPS
ncbi:COPII coat assembly protein SEC16-like [Hordeum vulgare]|nr:COPII coat assembly protein SEC16-like [Hordeum vulgare]